MKVTYLVVNYSEIERDKIDYISIHNAEELNILSPTEFNSLGTISHMRFKYLNRLELYKEVVLVYKDVLITNSDKFTDKGTKSMKSIYNYVANKHPEFLI